MEERGVYFKCIARSKSEDTVQTIDNYNGGSDC